MKFVDTDKIPDFPYTELRHVLNSFVTEVAEELGDNLVGIYLVGSIASGDFDLDSDVDFLVVTNNELSEGNQEALQSIQHKIHKMDGYPAKHLEGSYISIHDLNDFNTVGEKKLFYFDNGSTISELSTHDNQWHVRWVLREQGITLEGPLPNSLLPAIPLDELLNEVKGNMHQVLTLFESEISMPLDFMNSRFGQSFIVLTICRMLHTLNTGTVQSKKAGAEWAKQVLDPRWKTTIVQAWNERRGVRFGQKIVQRAAVDKLYETLEFIKYAINQIDSIVMA